MSIIVNISLVSIIATTNNFNQIFSIGTPLDNYEHKIQNSGFFNQSCLQYMYQNDGKEKIKAIKILLPYLDFFYDDNVIPIDHDVILYNYNDNIDKYNPYYFLIFDSYNGYFEEMAAGIDQNYSYCKFIKEYLINYFSLRGYGNNSTDDYYSLLYYTRNSIEIANGFHDYNFADLLDQGYYVFTSYINNSSQSKLGLMLGFDNPKKHYDITFGLVKGFNELCIDEIVAFKLNTPHYCSDNYYSYNGFKCLGCGSRSNIHHDHYTSQTTPESYTHEFLCDICNLEVAGDHSFDNMRYYNAFYHEKTCVECGYVAREAHFGDGLNGSRCPCRLAN